MNVPINDKELNTIISAMRLGGDAALYQKLRRIQEIRDAKTSESSGKNVNDQFGFVL
jgi:hypothetical protein|tara:strand:+ start:797 stop:967 length:171 start_codon:yes stop_codon:yes gene_type:complete